MSLKSKLTAIADAIRSKTGKSDVLTLDQMASDLNAILDRTASDVTESGATVTIPIGNYKTKVVKSVKTASQATPTISISSNGLITASANQTAGYVSAGTKNATKQLSVQAAKTITPGASSQTAVAKGVYTTGAVTVAAIPTVTQATPTISVDSAGKITASATQTAGYVSAGTKTGTKQLTTQSAKTITPSTSAQTAVAKGVYTTGAVTVGAIPSTYIQPSGTLNITTNGTHDVKTYANVNVNVNVPSSGGSSSDGSIELLKQIVARTAVELNDENITEIGPNAFYLYVTLQTVNLPNATSIGETAFSDCTGLERVTFPAVQSVGIGAFINCYSLRLADFTNLSYIDEWAFNFANIEALVLRSMDIVCQLTSTNALEDTPIQWDLGYIYVPRALIDTYKSATNWSTYAAQFRAIEDYTVDGTVTGELDMSLVIPE